MSLSVFQNKKQKILQQLAVPDSSYHDASPKGTVDLGIRALVDEINVLDALVTTSSCAGRIAVYLEGRKKNRDIVQEDDSEEANAGSGGKGGGQWLFVSHDPLPSEQQGRNLTSMFGMSTSSGISIPTSAKDTRWVRCKFEPMILHIFCSSVESAQRVQTAALGAGFRESGISNISRLPDGSVTAMAAIRTTGLAFDSVIGYEAADGQLMPMVDETYMDALVQLANERFIVNRERTERFRQGLETQFTQVQNQDSDWEPADVRKARKRAEGLARQAAAREKSKEVFTALDETESHDLMLD
ncbi:hypothetical protein AAFC00_001521 [Neodothiora populina]|uniref:tRNA(Phe) 7-[(3-amino-3-carboxypropyl)-4-demethylwyosine(37)-N(4)]-methyltransferase n=1 Tax=Neodothiora populina TaxID=2781224 RepID=A0ABR3PPK1_9PEZI